MWFTAVKCKMVKNGPHDSGQTFSDSPNVYSFTLPVSVCDGDNGAVDLNVGIELGCSFYQSTPIFEFHSTGATLLLLLVCSHLFARE